MAFVFKAPEMQALRESDFRVSRAVHDLQLGWFDFVLAGFALLCSAWGVPVLVFLIAGSLGVTVAVGYVTLVFLGLVLTTLVKRGTRRPRPDKHGRRMVSLRWMENNFSFPSGDSYQAAVFATLMLHTSGTWLYFTLMLPLVMFSRVYFGFHWVSDTMVGAALGSVVSSIALSLFYNFNNID